MATSVLRRSSTAAALTDTGPGAAIRLQLAGRTENRGPAAEAAAPDPGAADPARLPGPAVDHQPVPSPLPEDILEVRLPARLHRVAEHLAGLPVEGAHLRHRQPAERAVRPEAGVEQDLVRPKVPDPRDAVLIAQCGLDAPLLSQRPPEHLESRGRRERLDRLRLVDILGPRAEQGEPAELKVSELERRAVIQIEHDAGPRGRRRILGLRREPGLPRRSRPARAPSGRRGAVTDDSPKHVVKDE